MELVMQHIVPVNKFNSSIFSYFALVDKPEDIEAVELGEVRVKAPTNLVYSVSAPSSQMRSCRSDRRLLIDLGKPDPRLV
jgi:hypothetical protein